MQVDLFTLLKTFVLLLKSTGVIGLAYIELKPVLPVKAEFPIDVIEDGMVIVFKPLQI